MQTFNSMNCARVMARTRKELLNQSLLHVWQTALSGLSSMEDKKGGGEGMQCLNKPPG